MESKEIIPAIIAKDFRDLEEKLGQMIGRVSLVQIDVCDGKFTPKPSWPYQKNGIDPKIESIVKEEEGFPFWEEIDFEAHLMVDDPENVIDAWILCGAKRIIFHIESKGDARSIISELKERGVEAGIALEIDTPIDAIEPYVDEIDLVQFMGIDRIGFQGEEFDDRVIEKVRKFRDAYPHIPISVDGGVSLETEPLLLEAGATRLVVGSALFKSDDIDERLEEFEE